MLYNTLHNRWLRLLAAVAGQLICAAALNLFIVPLGLYTGGLMGLCQLVRTLLQTYAGVSFGAYDIAGILYFVFNVPILLYAYKTLGRSLVLRTMICTIAFSLFYSIIPIPATPIVEDYLTACLLGGILVGVGNGIVLTSGASGGGLDVIGLCMSKRGSNITVGRFSLGFNAFLYLACLFLFSPEVAIYSIIYNFFGAMVVDRMHQQNVNVQAMIFTREDESVLAQFIIDKLGRGVTHWEGI
ncbi:MAG: YitT family protein, partial [Oscillibacter sp.]